MSSHLLKGSRKLPAIMDYPLNRQGLIRLPRASVYPCIYVKFEGQKRSKHILCIKWSNAQLRCNSKSNSGCVDTKYNCILRRRREKQIYLRKPSNPTAKARKRFVIDSRLVVLHIFNKGVLGFPIFCSIHSSP